MIDGRKGLYKKVEENFSKLCKDVRKALVTAYEPTPSKNPDDLVSGIEEICNVGDIITVFSDDEGLNIAIGEAPNEEFKYLAYTINTSQIITDIPLGYLHDRKPLPGDENPEDKKYLPQQDSMRYSLLGEEIQVSYNPKTEITTLERSAYLGSNNGNNRVIPFVRIEIQDSVADMFRHIHSHTKFYRLAGLRDALKIGDEKTREYNLFSHSLWNHW